MMKGTYNYAGNQSEVPLAVPVSHSYVHNNDSVYFDEEADERSKQAKGAAVLCGVAGCFVGGPILAALAAFGGAFTASRKKGAFGDVARAVGDVAIAAGDKARASDLLGKSSNAAKVVVNRARETLEERPHTNI
mmetsp:Transcript_26844/g.54958  ORF Transcript_26844/g.54958 Transcript_26844/m.54958 type:complete len:134 (-) Transcript_26844:39-440(-)|eukprot:CAMPEP_0183291718 /NCGR_PEP_ID=MMETSP0160_2-20130417/1036_1 /TAXON_ID=2839 ORGANISM="Odontella Sinensis, Strain Grunow 1884" /NCGR_SAMPLE_ID=MMETSP0160_2 /ASSEMBLY_ACC=CAM_ASM_000250 /LENGTH=133 /DNA_ID=CAMNT_0025452557 /DNA_START=75 /DNA_END=476 /DNA_ORIENTATION=-